MGQGFKQAAPGVKVGSGRIGGVSNNGEISLADLLNNAGNKEYVIYFTNYIFQRVTVVFFR